MDIEYDNLYNLIQNNMDLFSTIKTKYLNLLKMLTESNDLSDELFLTNIKTIHNFGKIIIGYIKENDNIDIIVSGTIIIEPKLIRSGKSVGHIEDIVVHIDYRSKGYSQAILNKLKEIAIQNNCYKVILDCEKTLVNFYSKNGFSSNGIYMSIYF